LNRSGTTIYTAGKGKGQRICTKCKINIGGPISEG
jgi:hypothetical protein